MSYFHCGNGYPDRCNGYKGPLDVQVCTSARHKYDESGRQIPDSTPQPPPCLNCGCPWDSCLVHAEFCCDACAHFDPTETES